MNKYNHDDERTELIWYAFKQLVKAILILIVIIAAVAYYVTR